MSVQERLVHVTVDEFCTPDSDVLSPLLVRRAFGTTDVAVLGCTAVHIHDLERITLRLTAEVPEQEASRAG